MTVDIDTTDSTFPPLNVADAKVADLVLTTGRLNEEHINGARQEMLLRPGLGLVDALVVTRQLGIGEAQGYHDRAVGTRNAPLAASFLTADAVTDWKPMATGFRAMGTASLVFCASAVLAILALLTDGETVMGSGWPFTDARLPGTTVFLMTASWLVMIVAFMFFVAGQTMVASSTPRSGGLRQIASVATRLCVPGMLVTITVDLILVSLSMVGAREVQTLDLSLDALTSSPVLLICAIVYGLLMLAVLIGGAMFVWFVQRTGMAFGNDRIQFWCMATGVAVILGLLVQTVGLLLMADPYEQIGMMVVSLQLLMLAAAGWYVVSREAGETVRPD